MSTPSGPRRLPHGRAMGRLRLLARTLWYFRWTNLAAMFAVAVGTASLTGSLVVGDSVRHSLANIVNRRLGDVDHVLVTSHFFTDSLPARLSSPKSARLSEAASSRQGFPSGFTSAEPLIITNGSCVEPDTGATAARVNVFGRTGVEAGTCVVSGRLARGLRLVAGKTVVVRMDPLQHVPAELPVGAERTEVAVLRLRVGRVAEKGGLEDAFSLHGTQRPVRNIWVPLGELQDALDVPGSANVVFVAAGKGREDESGSRALDDMLAGIVSLEDYGLKVRDGPGGVIVMESQALLLPKHVEEAARRAFPGSTGVFAYIVNTVRDLDSGREFPYSTVAGVGSLPDGPVGSGRIVLNRWAAEDLNAKAGDRLELAAVVRAPGGLLDERPALFELDRIVETAGVGADRTLVPEFKGVTDAATLSSWNPPRDFDFRPERIRQLDEDYWERFRAAPKAFVDLDSAQKLWGTSFGALTSVRFSGVSEPELRRGLRRAFSPQEAGLVFRPIRHRQLQAAGGNTDFGQLFAGLSIFLVVSSALLVVLIMRLSVAQRSRQIGVMFAVGHGLGRIRNLFLAEGMIVLAAGCALGAAGSVGYAWLMLVGLKTLWKDALGTTLLALSTDAATIAVGFLAGIAVGAFAVWRGVGRIHRMRVIEALSGKRPVGAAVSSGKRKARRVGTARRPDDATRKPKAAIVAVGLSLAAAAVVCAALASEGFNTTAAFFIAGVCLLGSFLAGLGAWLTYLARTRRTGAARSGLVGHGVRNASRNPSRSALTAGLLASASFVTVAVGAMKAGAPSGAGGREGGTGGYALVAEFDVPIPYDLNLEEGRDYLALALADEEEDDALWQRTKVVNMRTSPGEDVSCRNLFRPSNPRVTSVPDALVRAGAFSFASKLKDVGNPWDLLDADLPGGEIPVVADYETARWILYKKPGDTVGVTDERGVSRTLRIVGLLRMSIFQGELLVGEGSFRKLFPSQSGYRQILIEARPEDTGKLKSLLEEDLADFGVTVETAAERLASFTRVADSYISAFEVLGGLGMLLGSFGLVAVLVRGVVDRRSEIALMSALGFTRRSVALIVSAENVFLLLAGMLAGTVSAVFAVAPEFVRSHGRLGSVALTLAFFLGILLAMTLLLRCVSAAAVRRVTPASLRLE